MPLQLPGWIISGIWNGRKILLASTRIFHLLAPHHQKLPYIDSLGQTKPPTYWHWTVPLNNAQMGLLTCSANCRCRAERGANGRSHTSFRSPVPLSKWDTWFSGSRWWHCGLASNNRTLHLITRSAQTKKKISPITQKVIILMFAIWK